MKGHKFVKLSVDDLHNGTGVIIKLDEKTDTICICMSMKEIIIFPIIEGDE